MAVATPTMLPVPTRPDKAMAKAWNEVMPVFCVLSVENSKRAISPKRRTCTKRVPKEKYNPAKRHKNTKAGLHTQPFTVLMIFSIISSYLLPPVVPERPLPEFPLEELLEELLEDPLELLLEELEVPERLLSDELERLVLLEVPERPLLLVPELLELLPEVLPERLTLLEEPRVEELELLLEELELLLEVPSERLTLLEVPERPLSLPALFVLLEPGVVLPVPVLGRIVAPPLLLLEDPGVLLLLFTAPLELILPGVLLPGRTTVASE